MGGLPHGAKTARSLEERDPTDLARTKRKVKL
jgi:hypothetical protein